MIIAVPAETFPGERRVALVPGSIAALAKAGHEVRVQAGAGVSAGFTDAMFTAKGVTIVATRQELFGAAEVIACVRMGGANKSGAAQEIGELREGQTIIGFMEPLAEPDIAKQLAARGVTAFAMELVPRTTRAQSMDALSSQASIAGYKAVILGASILPRIFPMLTTAAGTIAPAKVLVMGAGVAGLQAIATARRLGAVVHAYDVRAAAKEQVLSLGARFVELPLETSAAEGKGGYAAEQSEEFLRKQRELVGKVIAESDVVITTAAIPGKRAPILVTADHVRAMAPGSVIVDLAAERGGNCELTRPGETFMEGNVTIAGPANLPSEVPNHASQLYAKNVSSLLLHLTKDKQLNIDREDEITRETMMCTAGQITSPRMLQG